MRISTVNMKHTSTINSFYHKVMIYHSTLSRRLQALFGIIFLSICTSIIIWNVWKQRNQLSTSSTTTNSSKLLFASILHDHETCQVTKVFPFRVGCPKVCKRATSTDEPMYRMSMAWYFGMPDLEEGIAYDRGINYQCPIEFVNNFRDAAIQMKPIQTYRDVEIKFQPRMHMSLNYLCCLRKNETNWVREVMYKWILDNYPFSISVKFDKFQCWHERSNSVTTIIIADEQSQHTLLKMSNDIEIKLFEKGIPTEVNRSQQMPFHVTLLGVYRGTDDTDPRNNITNDIPYIYNIVSNISSTVGSEWAGDRRMMIQHAPNFHVDGVIHAGKEPLDPKL